MIRLESELYSLDNDETKCSQTLSVAKSNEFLKNQYGCKDLSPFSEDNQEEKLDHFCPLQDCLFSSNHELVFIFRYY